MKSFKPQVSTNGGKTFAENNLTFATHEEAELSAKELAGRWFAVTDWRAVESDQPVNHILSKGVMGEIVVSSVGASV